MRTPNSRIRWSTVYASTEKNPITVRTVAIADNTLSTAVAKRSK